MPPQAARLKHGWVLCVSIAWLSWECCSELYMFPYMHGLLSAPAKARSGLCRNFISKHLKVQV